MRLSLYISTWFNRWAKTSNKQRSPYGTPLANEAGVEPAQHIVIRYVIYQLQSTAGNPNEGSSKTLSFILLMFFRFNSCLSFKFSLLFVIDISFLLLLNARNMNELKVFTMTQRFGTANNAQSGTYMPPTIITTATIPKSTQN